METGKITRRCVSYECLSSGQFPFYKNINLRVSLGKLYLFFKKNQHFEPDAFLSHRWTSRLFPGWTLQTDVDFRIES